MVDIGRDDRSSCCQFGADQLDVAVLSQRYEPHLLSDDTGSGVVHLGDGSIRSGTQRLRPGAFPLAGCRTTPDRGGAVVEEVPLPARVGLDVTTVGDPGFPQRRQANDRVATGPSRTVDPQWGVGGAAGTVLQ